MPRLASIFSTLAREGKPMTTLTAKECRELGKELQEKELGEWQEKAIKLESINAELVEALEFAVENVHLGTGPRYTEAIERMTNALTKARDVT